MTHSTRSEVRKLAEHVSEITAGRYEVTTYSPGDGVTRYALGTTSASDGTHDYFGDRREASALGAKEALVMLRAFLAGRDSVRPAR